MVQEEGHRLQSTIMYHADESRVNINSIDSRNDKQDGPQDLKYLMKIRFTSSRFTSLLKYAVSGF